MSLKASQTFAVSVAHPGTQSFVQWDDRIEASGPTHSYANEMMRLKWQNLGGDWLDADGTPQGAKPFATCAITSPPADGRVLQWTGPGMVALVNRLIPRNSGIHLRAVGIEPHQFPYLWSRESPSQYPRPTLSVQTSTGTFDLEAIADTWLSRDPDTYLGVPPPGSIYGLDYFRLPAALRFDLGGITGTVSAATMRITSSYPNPASGYLIDAMYLNMPDLVTSPAVQFPHLVESGGIARKVAHDLELKNHPSVLHYTDFSSRDELTVWGMYTAWEMNNNISLDGSDGEMSFFDIPKYGLVGGRKFAHTTFHSVSTAARLVSPAGKLAPESPFHRALGQGYDELYFRYLLEIEDNAPEFMVVAIKMPGFGGTYDFSYVTGSNPIPTASKWDARMGHGHMSKVNHACYWILHYYGADRPVTSGYALGLDTNLIRLSTRTNQMYCVEQRVKLNSPDGHGGWNADGIIEMWFDEVKVLRVDDRKIRSDARCQINEVPFFNIYSGGAGPDSLPLGPIGYRFSGICVATEYIGKPKEIAA